MPYIKPEDRQRLAQGQAPQNAGELNYTLTCLIDRYLQHKSVSYAEINTVIGVLECVKLELYRRIASPYEDEKQQQHGDVYSVLKPQ